ncbi:MAG: CARDB domain-containing protein [Chromatiales bacterium]
MNIHKLIVLTLSLVLSSAGPLPALADICEPNVNGKDPNCLPGDPPLPDLVPKLIVAPVNGSNTDAAVTLRVENQGDYEAPPGYVITIRGALFLGGGQTIADTPALLAGGSTEFFIGLASTLPAKVCARVDASDTVIEADEGNNHVCALNASLVN